MKAKRAVLLIASVASVLVALVLIGKIYFCRFDRLVFTEDAVQAICYEVHDILEEDGQISEVQIEACISSLRDASVINIGPAKGDGPVDVYGNPFRVSYQIGEGKTTVRCLSLGADGKHGTSDDIVYVYDGS